MGKEEKKHKTGEDLAIRNAVETASPILETSAAGTVENAAKSWKRIIFHILKWSLAAGIFLIIAGFVFTSQILYSGQSSNPWFKKINIFTPIQQLVESADKKLKGEETDRINILLLGMGGKKHSGGYLTDTIILASYQPSTDKLALLSIPRDMVVPIEGMGWRKINSINSYAEQKNPGDGGQASAQAIGSILDIPIDYFVRVDFQGFIKIIDELGGITVDVENTLDDYSYPVMGRESAYPYSSRYEHLHIEKGLQQMDGELALKYARSRHALGAEGSDFARARRQQKMLSAAKEKALSFNMLLKPIAVKNILEALTEHVSTDMQVWEMIRLWELGRDVDNSKITNKVLDTSKGGLLVNAVGEDGAYILEPRSGNFSEIQYLVKNMLSDAPEGEKSEVELESAKLEVLNGTWTNGLAGKTALDLEKFGFEIVSTANAPVRNADTTTIYDTTFGQKMNSLKILKEKLGAQVAFGAPNWQTAAPDGASSTQADFIVVVGKDLAQDRAKMP